MRNWKFELRYDGKRIDGFEGSCPECHRRGDEQATSLLELGHEHGVECFAYNEPLNRWDKMGVYRGHHVFTSSFGEDRVIKQDYSGMFAKTDRKEVRS